MKRVKDIKDKAQKFAQEVYDESLDENNNQNKNNKERFYDKPSTNPEQALGTVWGWFWMLWIGLFFIFIIVIISLSNPKMALFGILLLIGSPLWIIYCLYMMIPEIKIFGYTIFSRRTMDFKTTVNYGGRMFTHLTKSFLRENPTFAAIIFIYLFIIFVSILMIFM